MDVNSFFDNELEIEKSSEFGSSFGDVSTTATDPDDFFEDDYGQNLEGSLVEAHACSYCFHGDAESVVRCLDCNKWFCNGTNDCKGSHIINHLVRSRHKRVCLHEKSQLGETALKCYNCGCQNSFLLGFIPAKANAYVVLLCREPCLQNGALKEMDIDLTQWSPLIEDRQFLPWLVKIPSSEEMSRARAVTHSQILKLERTWREDPQAKIGDLNDEENWDEEMILAPTCPTYEDGYHYQNIMAPLVKAEADYDKEMTAGQTRDNIDVRWEQALSKRKIAVFNIPLGDSELKIKVGDHIEMKCNAGLSTIVKGSEWVGEGTVLWYHNEEVRLEMSQALVPTDINEGYSITVQWSGVVFKRMQMALRTFAVSDTSVSGYLYHKLLGHPVPSQTLKLSFPRLLDAPGLPSLNDSQAHVVRQVLQQPLSLVQGPPGTGKTVTSATIVFHLVQAQKEHEKVLVCAPSNVAVDHLTEKIQATGVKVVRLLAKSREDISSNIDHLCLHNMVRAFAEKRRNTLDKLFRLKDEAGELSQKDKIIFDKLYMKGMVDVLKAADVVCCTCSTATSECLKKFRFRQVLLDEATQATEPESMIPIVKGAKQLTLVGDHCQLGPVVMNAKASAAGLGQSLFERLIMLGNKPTRLEVQYRMHPCLSEFPSNTFYDGVLQNGVTASERVLGSVPFPWPDPEQPMFFLNCNGCEEASASGTSFVNRAEASSVERIVESFIRQGARGEQIGIITPYEGQRVFLTNQFLRSGKSEYHDLEIASVDAFQGREKDFVIVSCVRSSKRGIGFLRDARRLNVALTRAKYGLIVIGNALSLKLNSLWNNLLFHFSKRNLIMQGIVPNFTQLSLQLVERDINFKRETFMHQYEQEQNIPTLTEVNDAQWLMPGLSAVSDLDSQAPTIDRSPSYKSDTVLGTFTAY